MKSTLEKLVQALLCHTYDTMIRLMTYMGRMLAYMGCIMACKGRILNYMGIILTCKGLIRGSSNPT